MKRAAGALLLAAFVTLAAGCASAPPARTPATVLSELRCRNPEIVVYPGETRRFAYLGQCAHVLGPDRLERGGYALVEVNGDRVSTRRMPASWQRDLHRAGPGPLRWFSPVGRDGTPPGVAVYEAAEGGEEARLRTVLPLPFPPQWLRYVAGEGCGVLAVMPEGSRDWADLRSHLISHEGLQAIDLARVQVLFWSPPRQAFIVERRPGPLWGPRVHPSDADAPLAREGLMELTCEAQWRPLEPALARALAEHNRGFEYTAPPVGDQVVAVAYGDSPYLAAVLQAGGWRPLVVRAEGLSHGQPEVGPVDIGDVVFSSDGSRVAFSATDYLGAAQVQVYDLRTFRSLLAAPAGRNPRLGLPANGRELLIAEDGASVRLLPLPR